MPTNIKSSASPSVRTSQRATTQPPPNRSLKSIRPRIKKEKPRTSVYINLLSDDEGPDPRDIYEIEDSDDGSTRDQARQTRQPSRHMTAGRHSANAKTEKSVVRRSADADAYQIARETSLNLANTSRARTPRTPPPRMSPIIIDDDSSSDDDDEDIPSHVVRNTVTFGSARRQLFPQSTGTRRLAPIGSPILGSEIPPQPKKEEKPVMRPISVEIRARSKGKEPIVTIEISDDEEVEGEDSTPALRLKQRTRDEPKERKIKKEKKVDTKVKKQKTTCSKSVEPVPPQEEAPFGRQPRSCMKSRRENTGRTGQKSVKLQVEPEGNKTKATPVVKKTPVYKDCAVQADLPSPAPLPVSAPTPPCSDLDIGEATTPTIKPEVTDREIVDTPREGRINIELMGHSPSMELVHDYSPARRPQWTAAEHLELIREQSSLVRAQIGLCRQFHEYRAMEHEAFVFKCRRKVQQLAWGAMPTLFRGRKRRFEEICGDAE